MDGPLQSRGFTRACVLTLVVAACQNHAGRPAHDGGSRADAPGGLDAPAAMIDASSSPLIDAAIDARLDAPPWPGSDAGVANVVSCYSEGVPTATCTLPVHCCFSNYSAQHDGACSTAACIYGTITCDGPEDCPSGQRCCAHALQDASGVTTGYTLACQASACGGAPFNQELCHPTSTGPAGTCSTSTAQCVNTYGVDNDLPRSLYICH